MKAHGEAQVDACWLPPGLPFTLADFLRPSWAPGQSTPGRRQMRRLHGPAGMASFPHLPNPPPLSGRRDPGLYLPCG